MSAYSTLFTVAVGMLGMDHVARQNDPLLTAAPTIQSVAKAQIVSAPALEGAPKYAQHRSSDASRATE